ncbi:MAG: transglycosylase domain-containing protein [Mycobacterium leprae]
MPGKQQQRKKRQSARLGRVLLGLVGLLAVLLLGGAVLTGCNIATSAPDVTNIQQNSSTVIYDRNGKEAYRLFDGENRTKVQLSQVPAHVVDAFIAIEDPNFYSHHGIDPRGLARAVFRSSLYYLHLPGGQLEGGSTITQQLARDAFLTQEVTMKRKLQEAWVAIQLERKYTKNEILEMYLNQIYFGHGAYGIEAAANTFFGKDVTQLTDAEGAQLAGMINGPSYFDPYEHPRDSIDRRNLVLDAMLKENFLDQAAYQKALAEQPKLSSKQVADNSSYFTDYVINILDSSKPGLAARYGLKLGDIGSVAKAGLKVYTTLDPKLQKLAEQAVSDQMTAADKRYGNQYKEPRQAAMVVMNPHTGEVLAMVGGRDRTTALGFNRATDANRQPGSSIKPLVVYVPALAKGLSPATILDDAPVMLTPDGKDVWPQNYDFKFLGLKSMRYGVEQSLNPVAIRAMMAAGGPSVGLQYAQKFGLTSIGKEDENLALALGGITQGVSVLDMADAYSGIANMGTRVDPVVISKIVDASGNTIFESHPTKQQVASAAVDYLMVDMMKGVIQRGTAYGYTMGFKGWPAAGKTGTTENNRDGWFIGFTPDLVAAVWNGYDTPTNTLPYTGAFVPVQIWNQFMTQAVTTKPTDWARPADVVTAPICKLTGMTPNELCPKDQVGTELFVQGTQPTSPGDMLVKAKAVAEAVPTPDKKSTYTQWQIWQPGCLGTPVERIFIRRPDQPAKHPTDPLNPKYVPQDSQNDLPTVTCQPVSWWQRLFPGGTPTQPGTTPPTTEGTTTVPPGTDGTATQPGDSQAVPPQGQPGGTNPNGLQNGQPYGAPTTP